MLPRWSPPLLLLLALTPFLKAEKLVIANSTASREYLERRTVDGKRQPQTYVFMAGRHFAGTTRDRSLEKFSFQAIAERLAVDLRQQDFYPAGSLPKADLLLIVHWGVTAGRNSDSVSLALGMENLADISRTSEESERQLAEAIERVDVHAAESARADLENLRNETKSESASILRGQPPAGEDSAALLGLSAAVFKDDDTLADYERRKTLFGLTREECYFVIVMAYDAPTLLSTKKLKRVWTLRASISSAGVNFPEALDRIGHIAGRYFGTRQANVTFDYPAERKRKESVVFGEVVVIGTINP
jgi:hypothetical protein